MQRVALAVAMAVTLGYGYLAGVAVNSALAAPAAAAEPRAAAPAADVSGKLYRGGTLPAITVVAHRAENCRQARIS
jgi:hypothetical protein